MTPDASDDEVRELALRIVALCADSKRKHGLNFGQLYYALALAICDVVRSCDCARCRERVLRHVRVRLPKELNKAWAYAKDKYLGVAVGRC
jgi:hypothetical protein